MNGKVRSGIMLTPLLVITIASTILFSFRLRAYAQLEEWIPCFIDGSNVELDYWRKNGISHINLSIEFPSTGYNVSDWGTPTIEGNNISVNAQIWCWTGVVFPVVIEKHHTYNLGSLPEGEYVFTFKIWGFPVKNTTFAVTVSSALDIEPNTIDLKDEIRWVTAYIEFLEGYNISDIDVSTIMLNVTVPVDSEAPTEVGDYDDDDVPDLMVKFDRVSVIDYITERIDWSNPERTKPLIYRVTLTVTGTLYDAMPFEGSDTIRALKFLQGYPTPT